MEIKRYDSNTATITRNDDGSITASPVVTRAGIFLYRKSDGSTIRELRHPDEVFCQDSLDTMKMIPVTNNHPSDFVTADNARDLSIGYTGENVIVDSPLVSIPVKINTTDGVDAAERGRLQLSLGYTAEVIADSGTYNGQPYDTRQTNIKYNHLAIVDQARAGSVASMRLDSEDAELIENGDNYKKDGGNMSENKTILRLDKADYEIPVQVDAHINKLDAKITDAGDALASKQTELDTVQAKLDTAVETIANQEKQLTDEAVQGRVDSRLALLDKARSVCGDEIKTDMADADIQKAVILKVFPEAKLDGQSEDYLSARMDSALEVHSDVNFKKQAESVKKNDDTEYVSRADSMKKGTYKPKTGSN